MDVSQWRDAAEYSDSKAAEMRAFRDSGASRCVSLWRESFVEGVCLWDVLVEGVFAESIFVEGVFVESIFVEYLSIL